jgi:hypothetical protein
MSSLIGNFNQDVNKVINDYKNTLEKINNIEIRGWKHYDIQYNQCNERTLNIFLKRKKPKLLENITKYLLINNYEFLAYPDYITIIFSSIKDEYS